MQFELIDARWADGSLLALTLLVLLQRLLALLLNDDGYALSVAANADWSGQVKEGFRACC